MDIVIQYAIPILISGIFSVIVATIANNKSMALIEYRLAELEKKLDHYHLIDDRVTKCELRLALLEQKGE